MPSLVHHGHFPSRWSADLALASQGELSVVDLLSMVEQMQAEGRNDLTVELYRIWLAKHNSPLAYAIWFNLGVNLAEHGSFDQAVIAYKHATVEKPDFLPPRFNLGTAWEKLGQPEAALKTWNDILVLAPSVLAADRSTHKLTLNNLGRLLELQRRYQEAETVLLQSLTLDQEQPDVVLHWLHLRQKQCAWPLLNGWPGSEPKQALQKASALSTLALTDDPELQLAASRHFVKNKLTPIETVLAPTASFRHDRLRIGYLSGDFCLHPVAMLMVELFELHDRTRFEVFGYCWSPEDGSSMRQRIMTAMDHFIRIAELDDETAARRIRDDEIDILIDLQGLTAGARSKLLSYRPAPLQITYLGFPGTTSHPHIDYIIADNYVIPTYYANSYSETPLYLPNCFQPSDRQREVAARPSRSHYRLPETAFVFCCFNNNYKITPELFSIWMRILDHVPDSILWLLADNPWAHENLINTAKHHGIDSERLIFAEREAPPAYLARYPLADLFLDTYPFNAGTTANDALWMGLPLLTLSGRAFASRMAGSLLRTLGLADTLVTTDITSYETRAVELATTPGLISQVKQKLNKARTTSPVFDMKRFTLDLESTYSDLMERYIDTKGFSTVRKRFLHVGCGSQPQQDTLPLFNDGTWDEIRLDIDPAARPDILGSMTDLSALADNSVDAIFSKHNLEHLNPYDVPIALKEFRRVLREDGFAVIICPDLQSICTLVAANRLTEPAYISPAGPISALDMLYGHQASISQGKAGMAHRGGFTRGSLSAALREANYHTVSVIARPQHYDLWAIASKNLMKQEKLEELVLQLKTT